MNILKNIFFIIAADKTFQLGNQGSKSKTKFDKNTIKYEHDLVLPIYCH